MTYVGWLEDSRTGYARTMDQSDPTPRFDCSEASRIAHEVFGIAAVALSLPSERDQNFCLTTDTDERYALKVAKANEEQGTLELQNAALRFLELHRPALAVPRVVLALDGAEISKVEDASGRIFFVRVLSWVEGETFVRTAPHDSRLLISLGSALADLDMALTEFQHPAMHRTLHWDLRRLDSALKHLTLLPLKQQRLVTKFGYEWKKINWEQLRRSVIHGDVNDYNVMVRAGTVSGFLDFGDTIYSATICDLAIALAYAALNQEHPIPAAVMIASAYHERFPLKEAEVDALYPLMTARLCMSGCYAAYNSIAKKGDPYQTVTAAPAWALLERLADMPPTFASASFSEGLNLP